MPNIPLLKLEHVDAKYGKLQALWNVSISISRGSMVGIIGSNGAGKSTIIKLIAGLMYPEAGKIFYSDTDITREEPHQRVKRGLIVIPDSRGLFPEMTVKDNFLMAGYVIKDKKQIQNAIDKSFELFPVLKKRMYLNAGSLSGGEQQMLAVAKALVSNPKLLVLDEPSSGLAPVIIDQMFEVLEEIKKIGVTILLIEQNVQRALNACSFVYILENGIVRKDGEANLLRENQEIRKIYLGL